MSRKLNGYKALGLRLETNQCLGQERGLDGHDHTTPTILPHFQRVQED